MTDAPWCYIFGGSTLQVPYLHAVRNLGYGIVLFDQDEKCAGKKHADHFVPIGYDKFYKQGIWLRHWNEKTDDDVIFTAASHQAWEAAAVLALRMRIPFLPPERVVRIIDRTVFYRYCRGVGVNVPYWEEYTGARPNSFDALEYWIKADYTQAPRYVWRVTATDIFNKLMPRVPKMYDRFYRKSFIIQADMRGVHFNVNVWPGGEAWFMKDGTRSVSFPKARPEITRKLRELSEAMEVSTLLMKYHVIANETSWACIDARLDPPNLMRQAFERMGRDFCKAYVTYMTQGDHSLLRAGAV